MSVGRSNSQQNQHPSWNQTDQLATSAMKTLMILTYSGTLSIQFVTAAGKVLDFQVVQLTAGIISDMYL
jgi:hypothetical protein